MRKTFVMHSALPLDGVPSALARSVDHEQRARLSLSGYEGSRAVIGQIKPTSFRLRKRNLRNDFSPVFYGRIHEEPGGTRVEGYFDLSDFVKEFMRWWLIGIGLMGALSVVAFASDHFVGSHFTNGNSPLLLLILPLMLLLGLLVPRIGALFAVGEESFLLDFLQRTLAARLDAGKDRQPS